MQSEELLYSEAGRAYGSASVPKLAGDDLELSCSQRLRPLVEALAQAGRKVILSAKQVAADHEYPRVEQTDGGGKDLAVQFPDSRTSSTASGCPLRAKLTAARLLSTSSPYSRRGRGSVLPIAEATSDLR